MPTIFRAIVLIAAACLTINTATAHGTKTKTIEIVHPWTYEKPSGDTVVVAMKIKNIGRRIDRLLGATTPLAKEVGLFEVSSKGAPVLRSLEGISIAPGKSEELNQKGRHLVLSGFQMALAAYDTFPLTLIFERAGQITVEVLVEEGQPTQ